MHMTESARNHTLMLKMYFPEQQMMMAMMAPISTADRNLRFSRPAMMAPINTADRNLRSNRPAMVEPISTVGRNLRSNRPAMMEPISTADRTLRINRQTCPRDMACRRYLLKRRIRR